MRKHHCGAKLRISATSRNCRDFRFILYSITIIIEGKARRLQPVEYRRVSLHHRVFDPRSGRRPQQIDACGSSLFFFFFFLPYYFSLLVMHFGLLPVAITYSSSLVIQHDVAGLKGKGSLILLLKAYRSLDPKPMQEVTNKPMYLSFTDPLDYIVVFDIFY